MGVMHLSSGAAPLAVLTDLASNRCFRRLARAATFAELVLLPLLACNRAISSVRVPGALMRMRKAT